MVQQHLLFLMFLLLRQKSELIGNQYNGCDYDDSDQTFTIVSSVSIVQPNGGENYMVKQL